jgi:hypothetical protein
MRSVISSSNRPLAWIAAGALLVGMLAVSAPAQAGDFRDGWQNELGRIAAREVVRFGKVALFGGFDQSWAAQYPAPGYEDRVYAPPRHRPPARRGPPPWHPHHRAPVTYQPPPAYAPAPVYETPAYEEHIVYERYERKVNQAPSYPYPYPYDHRARY